MEKITLRLPRFAWDSVLEGFEDLCKKTRKLGIPLPPPPQREEIKKRDGSPSRWINVTVIDEPICLAGWHLVAAVDFEGTRPVVRMVPGQTVRFRRRKNKNGCDHCGSRRHRKTCYILQHESGTRKQVGSTCVKDFLGHDPKKMLWAFEAGHSFRAELEELGERGFRGQDMLEDYLTAVVYSIRRWGWFSRSGQAASVTGMATADHADYLRYDKEAQKDKAMQADMAKDGKQCRLIAGRAIRFAQRMKSDSDFIHNLKQVALNEIVPIKHQGMAAYIAQHYLREKGLEAAKKAAKANPSRHLGKVGDRVFCRVHVTDVRGYEGSYGASQIIEMKSTDGDILVWWTSTEPKLDRAKEYSLTGKVKRHGEYKGIRQTTVTRCRLE